MRLIADTAQARVPATSANLGPGFDSFGIAMDLWDVVRVRAITGDTIVHATGEGAADLPTGEDHLIVRALRVGLDYADAPQIGMELYCHNRIPHGRGLGSSAAATIVGLVLARGLISEPGVLSDEVILTLACEFEGHPDNAAPALYGGATIAYVDQGKAGAARVPLAPEVQPVLLVPEEHLATSKARSLLPKLVPHADAAHTGARAGLLTLALSGQREFFMLGTQDRLHQDYRAPAMPATIDLIHGLREVGAAAVISGAGPSVLILDGFTSDAEKIVPSGWSVLQIGATTRGAHLLA